MKTITLTKENPTSGEIEKYPFRYIEINIIKGSVIIQLTQANGIVLKLPSTKYGTLIKWDIIDFVKIEFILDNTIDNAIVDYKLLS